MRRDHDAKSERGQAGIGISEADAGNAVSIPRCQHAENLGQILDHDARAQFVEIELVDQRFGQRARHVEEKAATIVRRALR